MKRLLLVAVTLAMLAGLSTAAMALSWQTAPILGTAVVDTGDLVVTTGPIPITIPHYNMPGDPLQGVGSPSMTEFWADPVTGLATVATGSGVWLDPALYTVNTWFADSLGVHQGDWTETAVWDDTFIMNYNDGAPFAIGNWTYHEDWTQGGVTITSNTPFTVKAVPEPMSIMSLMLGIMGLGSVAGFRKLRRN